MKKFYIPLLSLLMLLGLSSCDIFVSSTYYIMVEDYSYNAAINPYLTDAVEYEIWSGSDYLTFYGTQDEAIEWFEDLCYYMESSTFASGLGVLPDSYAQLGLVDADIDEFVMSREVAFYYW